MQLCDGRVFYADEGGFSEHYGAGYIYRAASEIRENLYPDCIFHAGRAKGNQCGGLKNAFLEHARGRLFPHTVIAEQYAEGVFILAEIRKVMIDAGHGGPEPGAIFQGRKEKDDTLRLALAVGEILSRNGVDVMYTRVSDVYQSPLEKAQIANRAEADYFVSIHRNAMPIPGTASGIQTLVYENEGVAGLMAENINRALTKTGFADFGVQ